MDIEDSYNSVSELSDNNKNSPNVQYSIPLLFKFKVEITSKLNLNYNVSFLNLPVLENLNSGELGSMIFPMSTQELMSHPKRALDVVSLSKGSCSLDLSTKLDLFCQKIDSDGKFPLAFQFKRNVWLEADNHREIEVEVDFSLECVGKTIVQDAGESSSQPEQGSCLEKDPPMEEFDEYCAEVNGHTLNIRMRRNPKRKNLKKTSGSKAEDEVVRDDNQITFQMPSNQALCSKGARNAKMYNVRSCKQGALHGHDSDAIKVLPGKSSFKEKNTGNSFVIKFGKKGMDPNEKGRLELELTAPKPLNPDEFKKPSREISTQTEVQVTTVSNVNKTKNKK